MYPRKRTYIQRKKPYAKRRKYGTPVPDSRFALSAFPRYFIDMQPYYLAKLKYSTTMQAVHPAATPAIYEFRANGMYDPEVSVGGHQPFGFDEAMGRYKHFTVMYSTITAQMLQTTENSNSVWKLVAHKDTGQVQQVFNVGGINGINEMGITSTNVLMAANQMKETHRNTSTLFMDIAKMQGVKSPAELLSGSEYSGTAAADPLHQCYFSLVGWGAEGVIEDTGHMIQVDLVYYAVFTKPNLDSSS